MKTINSLFLILLLAVATTASALECNLVETGGQTLKSVGERNSGEMANAEYNEFAKSVKAESTIDAIGVSRIYTIKKIISAKKWDSGQQECNDYKAANLVRICTKGDSANSVACATVCEQLSYSDDCR